MLFRFAYLQRKVYAKGTIMRAYYPRGENYDKVTSQKVFYEIRYYKFLVVDGEVQVSAFYSNYEKMKKAFDRVKESGVRVYDVIKWTLPDGFNNLTELASDIKFHEASESIYDYGKLLDIETEV